MYRLRNPEKTIEIIRMVNTRRCHTQRPRSEPLRPNENDPNLDSWLVTRPPILPFRPSDSDPCEVYPLADVGDEGVAPETWCPCPCMLGDSSGTGGVPELPLTVMNDSSGFSGMPSSDPSPLIVSLPSSPGPLATAFIPNFARFCRFFCRIEGGNGGCPFCLRVTAERVVVDLDRPPGVALVTPVVADMMLM